MMKLSREGSGRPRLHAEAGQGSIEYLLVLVISTMIILTAIWQFNTAFRKYADQFFDGYIACLLETGALPGTGGECGSELEKFSLANGTSLGEGGGGGGSGSGGSGGTSGSGSDSSSGSGGSGSGSGSKTTGQTDPNAGKSGDGSGGSAGGGSEVGGSGSSSGAGSGFSNNARNRQRSTAVKTSGKGGDGKGREPLTAIGSVGQESSRDSLGRARKVRLDRSYGFGSAEDESNKSLTAAVTPVAKDDSSNLKPKKVAVDMTRKPASLKDKDDSGFSFGNLLRIMIIAGIIIAMIILFGGQILQIVKSSEK